MQSSENSPVFINSVLKVTASEDFNLEEELCADNPTNQTISELLSKQDTLNEKTE
jgi:hypothetical protein